MHKKKIAYLDYSHIFAGAERVLYTIVSNLDRNKFEPIIVFPYPMEHQAGYDDLDCPKFYLSDGVKWWMGSDRWRHPLRGTDFIARSIWGIRLARLLKREKVDILHVNLLRPDALMWILPAKKVGIKVIGHFRSQTMEWVAPKRVQRLCDIILCVSQFSRNQMLKKGVYTRSRVLYDSIDIDKFKIHMLSFEAKMVLGFPTNCFLMTSIGQLSRYKGHDNAIRAFHKVALSHKNVILYVAGGGNKIDLDYLKDIVEELPVSVQKRIFFSEKQVPDIVVVYKAADLVLSLTKIGEAFGLVPFEAAIMDDPFIAPNEGAVKEFIVNGKNGVLVDTNDVDAISSAMEWIMTHPIEVVKMNKAARQVIMDKLTPSVMARNLEDVYLSLR